MTQEEKAKRYDVVIERAKKEKEESRNLGLLEFIEENFPELKESEGERIKEDIITYLSTVEDKELIPYETWIAWLEKQGEHANFRNKIQIGDKVTRNRDGMLVNLSQLKRVAKKQGEQKKELFQELDKKLNNALENETTESLEKFLNEQKPAWSEEDEKMLQGIWDEVLANKHDAKECEWKTYDKFLDWLKSIKDRVQPQPKQEWSEEDEKMIQDIINDIAIAQEQVYCKSRCEDEINWLKFLKERHTWKPSDEQLEALESAVENCAYGEYQDCLRELIGQLKKLKE